MRDDLDSTGTTADLDYQHARFYSPHLSRYFSFDPVGGHQGNPQSWNRYSYVLGNPLKYIDPAGLAPIDSCTQNGIEVACEGTITVTADFLPTGFANFLGFGAFLRNPGALNNMSRLPGFMRGMTFQQALNTSVALGAGGDCASDPNCALLADVATTRPFMEALEAGAVEIAGGAVLGGAFRLFGRGAQRAFSLFSKGKGATSTARMVGAVDDFIGPGGRAFRNDAGDLVVESGDGLRQIRFDINSFAPHRGPHVHLIRYEPYKNKKVIIQNLRGFPDG